MTIELIALEQVLSKVFSVDSGVRDGEEKRKLIFLNRENRSPRELISWRLVIVMDVLHVSKFNLNFT